ncbi:hypothetical protein SS50377_21003 [Spironucleus salmonicida]|uniref:Uncharacterized protein n=1 Tax=Spironucleus salmonicida TaxID=348837 RepID=V6LGL3_9EUKA|nr:hypothetical protein SS50377_21003 [Spironucleus salmonicida]|eukprot:EST43670.1 Hypothetical protein SS50377_16714 [Spironucleus salmonicida]
MLDDRASHSILWCLQQMLPLNELEGITRIESSKLQEARQLVTKANLQGELADQRLIFAYKLLLWNIDSIIQIPSQEMMKSCGFCSNWVNIEGFNSKIINSCQYIEFVDYFINNFHIIFPQTKLELHNLKSVLKSSGKFYKEVLDRHVTLVLFQLYREKHQSQFLIHDLSSRISESLIQLSYSKSLDDVKENSNDLQQLLFVTKQFLGFINRANESKINVASIDFQAIIQLLLENMSTIVLFPVENQLQQHDEIVNSFLTITEMLMDILYSAAQMQNSSFMPCQMEKDTPQDSQINYFYCRKSVLVQVLDTFSVVIQQFKGDIYIQDIIVLLSSNFQVLVHQMYLSQWAHVSKQDKEVVKELYCGQCKFILKLVQQNNLNNYFIIISFLDLALCLFSSKVVFLDKLFMEILINIIIQTKQSGLIQKSISIITLLFKQKCVVQYTRSHFKQFQGQINCPQSVTDMICAIQQVVFI